MKKSLVESQCSYSLTSRICWRLPLLQRLLRDWTYTQSGTESGRSSLVQLFQEREYRWGSGEGLLCQQAICKRWLSVDTQGGAGPAASQRRVSISQTLAVRNTGQVSHRLCEGKGSCGPTSPGKGRAIASPPRTPWLGQMKALICFKETAVRLIIFTKQIVFWC